MTRAMAPTVRAVPWHDADATALRAEQRAELDVLYGTSDSEPGPAPSAADITVFLVAYGDAGDALGCGGLRAIDRDHGEIKRMYVRPAARGTGVSTALLGALEEQARGLGWRRLVLETGAPQLAAVRLYEREGYAPIPRFGPYADAADSLCFGKDL